MEGYCLYSAMYEFTARSDDELSLQPGDLVWIKPENIGTGSGWAVGRTDDKREGCFPESYVQLVDETGLPAETSQAQVDGDFAVSELADPTAAADDSAFISSTAETTEMDIQGAPALAAEQVAAATASQDSEQQTQAAGESYVAMYTFSSNEDGDLTFSEGEVITVTRSDGDWWTGVCGKRTGIFPANFVKKMDDQPPQASKEEVQDSQKQSSAKKPEIATVIAAYDPTSSEQLALQVGQLIQIRKKTDTGWWEGELQVRGQKRRVGWFPANFVKVLGPGGQRLSAEASGKIPPQQQPSSVSSTAKAAPAATQQAVALYDYQSQQADELGFVKGNIINVLSKEHADWWMGEIDGRTGIFPANFVGPVS